MLYRLLYIPAQFAIRIYCRHLDINDRAALSMKGPLLIAANHPNSFLDAIILSTLFKRPVYSLARGDAFHRPLYKKLLRSLNMFPVYRISEGAENLENNYETFEHCKEIFRKNGIVLIFSEGRCINEWRLRPLKKGTARLAQSSWQEGIPLKILPTGINYHSFSSFGKNVRLNFGKVMHEKDMPVEDGFGKTINAFNDRLNMALKSLIIETANNDTQRLEKEFRKETPPFKKGLLFIPAGIGYLAHAPVYIPIQRFCKKVASHNDHYDSMMVGLLFILYPVYLALLCFLLYLLTGGYAWLSLLILFPFCAWSYVQLKRQF